MLGTAIIVFREVFEAALIIGIAAAATREVRGRGLWVGGGVLLGVLGACIIAVCAGAIADMAQGTGQERFNAGVLIAAVLMLGWHNIWMARHGREMAAEMNQVGRAVKSGDRSLFALMLVVTLAVLREGSEVVLFLYGIAIGGSQPLFMFAGGVIGLATGGALGLVLYAGLLRIPMRHFFTVTSWLILLLAAGLAAQAAHFLIAADLLPAFGDMVWDTSAILDTQSLLGQALHTLVGYDPQPAGLQLVFYVATLLVIGLLMKLFGAQQTAPSSKPAVVGG